MGWKGLKRLQVTSCRLQGTSCRVQEDVSSYRVRGVQGAGFKVQGVQGTSFKVQGVQGAGFKVQVAGCKDVLQGAGKYTIQPKCLFCIFIEIFNHEKLS